MPVFDLSPAVRCKRIELHKVESYCSYLVRMVYCSYCRHFVIMINNEMSVDWILDLLLVVTVASFIISEGCLSCLCLYAIATFALHD